MPPLTRSEIADKIGVNRATVGRWEAGKRRPDDRYLPALAKLTGASVPELLGIASQMEDAE